MREILFRGKRIDNGEWVYGGAEVQDERYAAIYDRDMPYDNEVSVRVGTVGQYTGLNDKNGTKIFEGDIVLVVSGEFDEEDGNATIVWEEDNAQFNIEWSTLSSGFDTFYGTDCEVKGNIHDNPELLEG